MNLMVPRVPFGDIVLSLYKYKIVVTKQEQTTCLAFNLYF